MQPTNNDNAIKDSLHDLSHLRPYGDTFNDGKIQLSFTLPLPDNRKTRSAAKIMLEQIHFSEIQIVYHIQLDGDFTYFIVYATLEKSVDYNNIHVDTVVEKKIPKEQIDSYIKKFFNRQIVIIGATTGTDAHTVGIDAIMNMKGFAGHKGLEQFEMLDLYNLGSQVPNELFVKKAIELHADVLLVSQTVTQKDVHIQNLMELVELLEAENIRDQVLLICGGPRITNEFAKELGYDMGFGPGTTAEELISFIVQRLRV